MIQTIVCGKKSLLFWLLIQIFAAFICQAQLLPSAPEKRAPSELRFSASSSWSPPYAFFDRNKKLSSGIIKEVADAIANEMGLKPVYVTIPRKAVDAAVESNKIDARCYVIESWVQDPKLYDWSLPLFDIVNVVAFPIGVTPIRKIEDLKGFKIGTVLGYKYPKLDYFFADATIYRSDSSSETSNIEKLIQNRVKYAVVEISEFTWHLKEKDRNKFNQKDFFEIERFSVKCAVVKTSSVSVLDFNRAIEKLKKDGFLKKLVSKHNLR